MEDQRQNAEAENGERDDIQEEDKKIIDILDSLDSYLRLYHSLSQKMRQGWLDITSSRYSMGLSSIRKPMFSLKPQPAYSLVTVRDSHDANAAVCRRAEHVSFTLHLWEVNDLDSLTRKEGSSQLCRGTVADTHNSCKHEPVNGGKLENNSDFRNSQTQKLRGEALSIFGTLVPPSVRNAQSSFESVLEVLLEIANIRSRILSLSSDLAKDRERDCSSLDS